MRIQARRLPLLAVLVLALAFPTVVLAASGYTLFGDATLFSPSKDSPTAVQLTSTCPTGYPTCLSDSSFTYSGIDFEIPAGTTFAEITTLSTDYEFTSGSCGGGSPRFEINLTDGTNSGNVFVYIGPPPNYTGCSLNVWLNTLNLASAANLVDTGQLPAGTFYDSYSAAQAKYGTYAVTGIQLVADGGWAVAGNVQTVLVDNVAINDTTYTFEGVDSCKKDGWEQFISAPGPFKNQGACVSYFSHIK
jgi:hypothetical protein